MIIGISILGVFFAIIVIAAFIIIKKENKPRVKNDLDNFKKIFSSKNDKKITIKIFNYVENFNNFPFLSTFENTKQQFQSEELKSVLKRMENNFYNYWANKEYDFFNVFEQISKTSEILINKMILLKQYTSFAENSFNIYRQTFIQVVIPALICKYKKQDYKLTNYMLIDDIIDNEFKSFCSQLNDLVLNVELNNLQAHAKNNTNSNQQKEKEELYKAYRVLNVSPNDSNDKVKKAYRKLAKDFHPDKNQSEYAKKKMAEINDAYDKICKSRGI